MPSGSFRGGSMSNRGSPGSSPLTSRMATSNRLIHLSKVAATNPSSSSCGCFLAAQSSTPSATPSMPLACFSSALLALAVLSFSLLSLRHCYFFSSLIFITFGDSAAIVGPFTIPATTFNTNEKLVKQNICTKIDAKETPLTSLQQP